MQDLALQNINHKQTNKQKIVLPVSEIVDEE